MSSPTNLATSPPYPHPISLPKKRAGSTALSITAPDAKRRKPSSVASAASLHPLRQTSFPPQGHAISPGAASPPAPRSALPSREGSVSSFAGRGSVNGRGRRGRPAAADVRSLAGTATTGPGRRPDGGRGSADDRGSLVSGRPGVDVEEDEAEEDDADNEGAVDTMLEGGGKMDEATAKQEREHLAMLLDAFSPEQMSRYEMWRRVRLKKEIVRRLINQTLSQSVPASIVTSVNGYTKLFIGELIERARDVQDEWLTASLTLPTGEPNPIRLGLNTHNGAVGDAAATPAVQERDRGPLTPDHLREALRRYKKDREGGSVGFQGLSLYGKEATASRTSGKRLFR